MWYVNLNSKITKELTSACFILTMWYVNVKQVIVTLALLAAFYINYVA